MAWLVEEIKRSWCKIHESLKNDRKDRKNGASSQAWQCILVWVRLAKEWTAYKSSKRRQHWYLEFYIRKWHSSIICIYFTKGKILEEMQSEIVFISPLRKVIIKWFCTDNEIVLKGCSSGLDDYSAWGNSYWHQQCIEIYTRSLKENCWERKSYTSTST